MKQKVKPVLRALLAGGLLVAAQAYSQPYPNKPIRLVTEFVGGSGGDALLRVVMGPVSQSMGEPILIDSRPGAGGLVAAQIAANADPDGYTWLAGAPNVHTVRPWLISNNPFDSIKELTPITTVAEPYMGIIVNPSLPVRNMKELIEYARNNPGKLAYASSGIGSTFHLDAELIQMITGVKLVHVPYKSLQQAMGDVVTNQIPMSFVLAGQANSNVRAGKLKPIGILGELHYAQWPDVGLISDTVPGFVAPAAWTGLFGPAKMPRDLVQRIYREVNKSLQDPAVKAKLGSIGIETRGMAPDEFLKNIKDQKELIGRIVKSAGITTAD